MYIETTRVQPADFSAWCVRCEQKYEQDRSAWVSFLKEQGLPSLSKMKVAQKKYALALFAQRIKEEFTIPVRENLNGMLILSSQFGGTIEVLARTYNIFKYAKIVKTGRIIHHYAEFMIIAKTEDLETIKAFAKSNYDTQTYSIDSKNSDYCLDTGKLILKKVTRTTTKTIPATYEHEELVESTEEDITENFVGKLA